MYHVASQATPGQPAQGGSSTRPGSHIQATDMVHSTSEPAAAAGGHSGEHGWCIQRVQDPQGGPQPPYDIATGGLQAPYDIATGGPQLPYAQQPRVPSVPA